MAGTVAWKRHGDPDLVDIPIPGNDDSMRSIEVVVREMAEAVKQGKSGLTLKKEGEDTASGEDKPAAPKRRSLRSKYRAEDAPSDAAQGDAPPATPATPAPPTPEIVSEPIATSSEASTTPTTT